MKTTQLGIELGSRHLRIAATKKKEFLKIKNMIAFDEDDIFAWYEMTSNNEVPVQDDYIIKKINKRQNKFFDQY